MLVKFMILFHKPVNVAGFETKFTHFLAKIEEMPYIERRQIMHVTGSPQGEAAYYRILEVYFDTKEIMQTALNSQAGQRAGAALGRFDAGTVEMMFADVYEEAGGQTPKPVDETAAAEPETADDAAAEPEPDND